MIASVRRTLSGETTVWAVSLDDPRTGFGQPLYRALTARIGGATPGDVHGCALSQTPLDDKERITREEAAALHPDLVRRAEAEWATLDDVDSPDNAAGDTGDNGAAVLDELDRHDPALDITEVDALLIAEGGEA